MPIPQGWTQKEYDKRLEDIKLCGRNRGPHDWIPVRWASDHETMTEEVTHLMCRQCFNRVNTKTLLNEYDDLSIKYPQIPDTSL